MFTIRSLSFLGVFVNVLECWGFTVASITCNIMLMQPNQIPPPAPPPVSPAKIASPAPNPYAFLYEQPKTKKSSLLPSGNSTKQRIIYVVLALMVLIFVAMMVISFIGSAGKENTANLKIVVTKQAELIRVSNIGVAKSKDQTTKNLAITTSLSISSSQASLLALLKKSGINITPKDLALGSKSATTTLLSNAEQANNFDEVFVKELQTEISEYRSSIKTAYDSSSGENTKKALDNAFSQTQVLFPPKSN